ncbi:unnamed protein product, partial [Coregonus sp. 'balchen']
MLLLVGSVSRLMADSRSFIAINPCKVSPMMTIWTVQMGDRSNPHLAGHIHSTCAIPGLQGICNVADDHHSLEGIRQDECQPATSAATRREDYVTNPGRKTKTNRLSMHEKLAMEFNERKLVYLKEDHAMKMQILHVELAMKEEERNMMQQQYQ